MKTALPIFALLLIGGTVRADEASTAERIAALREAFRYAPVSPTAVPLLDQTEPAVVLERLTVVESMSRRALSAQIENRWARTADEAFAWKKGGLLGSKNLGKIQADFGAWVELGERITGANVSREIFVKIELLRLRW